MAFTLYAPDGRKYETGSRTEAVRLIAAYGYTETAPESEKSDEGKSKSKK